MRWFWYTTDLMGEGTTNVPVALEIKGSTKDLLFMHPVSVSLKSTHKKNFSVV